MSKNQIQDYKNKIKAEKEVRRAAKRKIRSYRLLIKQIKTAEKIVRLSAKEKELGQKARLATVSRWKQKRLRRIANLVKQLSSTYNEYQINPMVYGQWSKYKSPQYIAELMGDLENDGNLLEYNLKDFLSDMVSVDNQWNFYEGSDDDKDRFIDEIVATLYTQIDVNELRELVVSDIESENEIDY